MSWIRLLSTRLAVGRQLSAGWLPCKPTVISEYIWPWQSEMETCEMHMRRDMRALGLDLRVCERPVIAMP